MLEPLYFCMLDLWRLNYVVIILLPKVKPATHIKQFRPMVADTFNCKLGTFLMKYLSLPASDQEI